MGNCLRSVLKSVSRKRNSEKTITLLIVGLDNAGKTLILNYISGDPDKHVLPTMGFRTVCLKYKSYNVRIYDIGGCAQIRSLWSKYYNDIHGLIYVVDASDISRLTENKVVFSELVAHEHVSGKPLLLLANKQDLNEAIDELDLVDNLDVEHAVNRTKCPTRVETCSCFYEKECSKNNTMGITNGYKWLLDTISKNYTILNSRVKDTRNIKIERTVDRSHISSSPSRLSVHSNPFKPIKELISAREKDSTASKFQNGIISGQKLKKLFASRKTVPLSSENLFNEFENTPESNQSSTILTTQKSVQTVTSMFSPLKFDICQTDNAEKLSRPCTAPARYSHYTLNKTILINIPGQVPQ